MFKVHEYFDGRAKSIAFQALDGPATVRVKGRAFTAEVDPRAKPGAPSRRR